MTAECTISINNLPQFSDYLGCLDAAGERPSFVELLWDNFCHLDAERIAEVAAAAGGGVALHVMWSRFLEVDAGEWRRRLRRLRAHVDALKPVYVSDHLCRFTDGAARFAIPLEHDYRRLGDVAERVQAYQQEIGRQLLVENYASTSAGGERQMDFLAELEARTGCGLLFDISNARVAALNGLQAFEGWLDFIAGRALRCHAGGFARDPADGLCHDTHDRPLASSFEADFARVLAVAEVSSLSVERDQRFDAAEVTADLRRAGRVAAAAFARQPLRLRVGG